MQPLKKLGKPSRGVLLFAFNTNINYVKIADRAAQLIKKSLKLPITLVTDLGAAPEFLYDKVLRIDENDESNSRLLYDTQVIWKNGGRFKAYELSPYDETILLDADYLVLDSSLDMLFDLEFDYLLHSNSATPYETLNNSMGPLTIPHKWATAILFRKTSKSRMMFDLVGRIERNYPYYCTLYNLKPRNFRNDHAFTLADNIMNGYVITDHNRIPWPLFTLDKPVSEMRVHAGFIVAVMNDKPIIAPKTNLHVLDKHYLLSDNFGAFVETICAS